MQVVRDAIWSACLNDAVKMYRLTEPNEKCYRLADATWKMKNKYKTMAAAKMARTTQILDKVPEQPKMSSAKICCAMTISGKKCHFRAVCGNFCRKHNVPDELKSQLV